MLPGYEGQNGSSSFKLSSDRSPSNGCGVGGSDGRGLSSGGGLFMVG